MTRFAVPAYFHPSVRPGDWRALAALGPALAFAVMNPDSGPGAAADPRYHSAVEAVHEAGGRVIGYVDTAYGQRPGAAVLRDLTAYQSRYGLRGGFLDQVPSGPEHAGHYRRVAEAARRLGLDFLVANPGVAPAPEYADIFDVVVTFEGPWVAYSDHTVAHWMRRLPAERFCHLVHSAPAGTQGPVIDGAADRHAGAVYATNLTGANPWAGLSAELRSALSARPLR
ncbi:MAG TPA: spherulation-specific family 4 protein [Actinocrinis sp.]|nr:spherulation-specific family 4 protein [Actinocrinis sp.]